MARLPLHTIGSFYADIRTGRQKIDIHKFQNNQTITIDSEIEYSFRLKIQARRSMSTERFSKNSDGSWALEIEFVPQKHRQRRSWMKILVVDDSKAMRMIVKRTLRQAGFGSHAVEEAADGAVALNMIQADPPDLVLADWNMPEMNGLELLTELNKSGSQVKFGFVTSEGTGDMRQKASDEGALFLITKPFTPEVFQKTLSPILG
jgi:two-component system chemotaxis response regulator CheY